MDINQDIIKDCLKHRKDAQFQLYSHYADTMLGLCYRYTKSLADAEDVLQEGFIKVFTNLHQYKMQGDLGAWIRRIMVNTAINYLKKHSRYKKELQLQEVNVHPIAEDTPALYVASKELVHLIRTLPVGYQTIFNLIAVEGYLAVEVATLMNINVNTVRSQYSRARGMLIKLLEQHYQDKNLEHYARSI